MPVPLETLLIDQWQNAPRMQAAAKVINDVRDDALEALRQMLRMLDADHAEGWWLDALAARLGLVRPAATDPTQDDRFGFDAAGVGFDLAPFRGDAANDAVYPLPDPLFRRLVKAAEQAQIGDGTLPTFERAVREIDPTATVQDNRDMTIRVVTDNIRLMRIAADAGALPRSTGRQIDYADRTRFGFDAAGVGFDQGPFAGE